MKQMTKRILAAVAVLALLCTAVPFGALLIDAAAVNLFQNGDFENGTEGWTVQGDTAPDTSAPHGGSGALLLSHGTAYGEAAVQTVTVKPETDYLLSFWVKRVSGGGVWNAYTLDVAGGYQQIQLTSGQTWFNAGQQWEQLSYTFNSGALTSLFVKFSPESAGAGTLLLDDVSLTAQDEAAPTIGVLNGGFEDGIDHWKVSGSTAADTSAPHGGKSALLLSHGTAYGEAAVQTVTVEPDTDYTLTYWVKRVSGGGAWDAFVLDPKAGYAQITLTSGQVWFSDTDQKWIQKSVEFNSGDCTQIFLKFCPETASSGTFLLDDVSVTPKGEEPVLPEPPTPNPNATPLTLMQFTIENNHPVDPSVSVIRNGGFESADGAPWNVGGFLANNVTVVEDATAPEGNHSLFFNTSGTTESERHLFWVDVEPDTNYVFSVWVKGSFLSADSVGRATVGVIDPDTQKYLVDRSMLTSKTDRQIVPPAWDNTWHLRSVVFNSAAKTKVGIAMQGYGTELWLDNMALFPVDGGIKYADEKTYGSISYRYDSDYTVTTREDNLVTDGSVEQATSDFWQSGSGWKNGFVSIRQDVDGYGNSLCYTAGKNPVGVQYVKWIPIKPDTEYVFSVDIKVLKDGEGRFMVVDGKKRGATEVLQVDFSTADFGTEWSHVAFGFKSGPFTTIGIGVVDMGGAALIDNVNLFEVEDGTGNQTVHLKAPTDAQLWAATAKSGDTARYTVNATGEGLTYKWYYKDKGAADFAYSASYKTKTYSVPMTAARDGRQVYCVVTDKHGYSVQSRTVTLRMGTPFSVTQPSAQTVYAKQGATAKVALKATGDGLKYTWYVKNASASKYTKSSITKATYSVEMTSKVNGRRVYCVITDKFGNTTTTKTYLLRRQATITSQSATTRYAKWGATVSAKVTAVGDGLKYTWYVKNEGASKYSKSSVTKSTYSVTMGTKVKNRRIYCVVKDKYGKTVQSRTFILRESVSVTTQPKSVTVANKKTAKVTVKARGDGLKYTWYVKNSGSSKYSKSSITKSTYSVKMTSKVNGRRLYCVVKDKYGKTVQTKTVILKKK